MTGYVAKRLASGLLTLFLFVSLLFFIINIVIPGDWTSQFINSMEGRLEMQEQLGLDRPLWEQYLAWITGVFTLNLGDSFGRGSVTEALVEALPSTLLVLGVGLGLAFVLGGWMGRVAAYDGRSYLSTPITFVAVVFLTMFPPALAVLMERGLIGVFGFTGLGSLGLEDHVWDWMAIHLGEALSPGQVIWRMVAVLSVTLVVLTVLDLAVRKLAHRRIPRWLFLVLMVVVPLLVWRQMGIDDLVFNVAASSSLLLTGVVLLTFGDVLLVTRAAMDDVMLEDYVMVARAKGLPEKEVRDKHAARTALLPVLSRFTVSIPYFLTGLVILEAVFTSAGVAGVGLLQRARPPSGLGFLIFDAVADQDIPLIMGSLLVVGMLTLVLRIVLDVLHAGLDPRIRFGGPDDG